MKLTNVVSVNFKLLFFYIFLSFLNNFLSGLQFLYQKQNRSAKRTFKKHDEGGGGNFLGHEIFFLTFFLWAIAFSRSFFLKSNLGA